MKIGSLVCAIITGMVGMSCASERDVETGHARDGESRADVAAPADTRNRSRASGFEIARDGAARTEMVVPAAALPNTREAAEELARYIEKISGARVQIVEPAARSTFPGTIWVGVQPGVEEAFPGVVLAFAAPEEIRILSNGRHLLIAGRDRGEGTTQVESGTANAVYTFLQRHLGIRWFWPGPSGEDVPRQSTLVIPEMDFRFIPTIRQRQTHRLGLYSYRGFESHEQLAAITGESLDDTRRMTSRKRGAAIDWYRVQRAWHDAYDMNAGHAFTRWWQEYAADHPDFFALRFREAARAGERIRQPDRVKLCKSNPAVHRQWLENAEAQLRRRPHQIMVSATPNDGGGFCTCDDCRAWDHPSSEALTDRMVRFWNILARGLHERFPDREVYVGGLAYSAYRSPPIGIRLEDNVAIGYVGHMPITGTETRERERRVWLEWAQQARNIVYRPNLFHYSGGMLGLPVVALQRTAEDFRFLAENSCVGLNIDSVHEHWGVMAPQYYLMNQLAWDPFQDAGALMDDFYARAFGPAAHEVAAYFSAMEQVHYRILDQVPMSGSFRFRATGIFQHEFSPEIMAEARALLDRAAEHVSGAEARLRERVAFIRAGFDFADLQIRMIRAMARVRESEGRDTEAVREAVALSEARDRHFREHLESFVISHTHYLSYIRNRGMADYLGPPAPRFLQAAGLTGSE